MMDKSINHSCCHLIIREDIQCLSPAKKHVTQNGNPDWTYMEAYMSKVMHECEESLTNLTNIVSDGGVDAFLELN